MDLDRPLLSEELNQAVKSLSEVFAARSIRYALIGGLATYMRGRVRFTKDVVACWRFRRSPCPGYSTTSFKVVSGSTRPR